MQRPAQRSQVEIMNIGPRDGNEFALALADHMNAGWQILEISSTIDVPTNVVLRAALLVRPAVPFAQLDGSFADLPDVPRPVN